MPVRVPDAITIAEIERFQWLLDHYDPARPPLLPKGKLSLAAAAELFRVLQDVANPEITRSITRQLADCPIWTLLRKLRGRDGRVCEGNVAFSRIPTIYDQDWYVEEMRLFQATLVSHKFPQRLSASLTGGVFEIVDNVWRHSQAPAHSLLAYKVVNRTFSFSVCDGGVGVLASLTQNRHYAYLKTSVEALDEAVKPNVSALPNGSGLGFDTLVRALADLWGKTRLRSGEGVLLFNRETERHSKQRYFLPRLRGLHVSGICRLK